MAVKIFSACAARVLQPSVLDEKMEKVAGMVPCAQAPLPWDLP